MWCVRVCKVCLCVYVVCVCVFDVCVRCAFCLCGVFVLCVCVCRVLVCVSHIVTNNSVIFKCRKKWLNKLVLGTLSPGNLKIQRRSTVT